jgi:hypothetical protein
MVLCRARLCRRVGIEAEPLLQGVDRLLHALEHEPSDQPVCHCRRPTIVGKSEYFAFDQACVEQRRHEVENFLAKAISFATQRSSLSRHQPVKRGSPAGAAVLAFSP